MDNTNQMFCLVGNLAFAIVKYYFYIFVRNQRANVFFFEFRNMDFIKKKVINILFEKKNCAATITILCKFIFHIKEILIFWFKGSNVLSELWAYSYPHYSNFVSICEQKNWNKKLRQRKSLSLLNQNSYRTLIRALWIHFFNF